MKTVLKRISAVVLAGAMVITAFTGCNSSSSSDKIIIGGIGPLTGTTSTYGNSVKNAAEIAIEEINKAGGINGVDLELKFQDDESTGDKAKSAYETLMDDGMDILLGCVTSGASVSLNDLIKKDGILQVTPSASQLEAVENPNSFRICFTDPMQAEFMADYCKNTLKYSKAAIIYNQDDSYSTGIYNAFKEAWKGEIAVEVSFTKDAADFNAQVTKIASSDADFIFMPIYAEKAASIVIAANDKGVKLPIVGCDGLDGILTYLTGSNAALANGILYLTPFVASDSDERVQSFVEKYKAKTGSEPDQFAANAYDAVYVIKAALEKAGVKSAADIDNAALVAAMNGLEYNGLTGDMKFGTSGESNKAAKYAKIEDGKYVVIK